MENFFDNKELPSLVIISFIFHDLYINSPRGIEPETFGNRASGRCTTKPQRLNKELSTRFIYRVPHAFCLILVVLFTPIASRTKVCLKLQ